MVNEGENALEVVVYGSGKSWNGKKVFKLIAVVNLCSTLNSELNLRIASYRGILVQKQGTFYLFNLT